MSKAIARFDPTPTRTHEECERHYTEIHVRVAQDLMRSAPGLRSYHIDRVLGQADIAGGWSQRPRAWRFAIVRYIGELAFTSDENEIVAEDHVNCVFRLRHCDVDERVVMDRRREQLALAKFMIEAERPAAVAADVAWRAFEDIADRVHGMMKEAFGSRLLIVNEVLNELDCEAIEVEGQRPVGIRAETTRVGYIEAYFDHRRWGEEALVGLALGSGLRHEALVDVNLLHVEELAPLDKG